MRAVDGAKVQHESDYSSAINFPLRFDRSYGSFSFYQPIATQERIVGPMGNYWHHPYARKVFQPVIGIAVMAILRDGEGALQYFDLNGMPMFNKGRSGAKLAKVLDSNNVMQGWIHTTPELSVEKYDSGGNFTSITNSSGATHTMHYDSNGDLSSVTDDLNRSLQFTYNDVHRLLTMTDPAGGLYIYGYDEASSIVLSGNAFADNLTSVTFPDGSKRIYWYNEQQQTAGSNLKNALTGITDENGIRFASWKYNSSGQVISSEHAGGVEKYTLDSASFPGTQTKVTDPRGIVRTYSFATVAGVQKGTGMSQPAGAGSAAASQAISYDSSGNVASRTDLNGAKISYTYDLTRNLEVSRTEASGTSLARTATTEWHPLYRLPLRIAEPKRITTYTYDGAGNQISMSAQATTDSNGTQGTAAVRTGVARTWSATYNSIGQLLTSTGPRTDVQDTTTYAYDDSTGNLLSVTNPAGQVTSYSNYDAHGHPGLIVAPNGVSTELNYTPRGWLASTRVTAGGLAQLSQYEYDGVGHLKRFTAPDGAMINYNYDAAERLVGISDSLGNSISYTLDAMGNKTAEKISDPGGALSRQTTRIYDALNRLQQQTGGLQ